MLNFTLILNNGKAKNFQALDLDSGFIRAEAIITRTNAESGCLYRVNPYGTGRKHIASILNEDHDPERPTLTEETFTEPAPAEKPSKRSQKRSSSQRKVSDQPDNSNYPVTLHAIAERIGKEPADIRRKLRKSSIQKPGNRWAWKDWENEAVKEILNWGR